MSVLTAIARTITLQNLKDESRYGSGQRISESVPSKKLFPVEDFVKRIFPGQVVEHLGRKDMQDIDSWKSPSSLFFQAVHHAYAEHHALGLRPEVLMYLVNGVIAETVRRHPETYRHLFTESDKKERIDVHHNGLVMGDSNSPWNEVLTLFEGSLRERVPSTLMNRMLPSFTTSTPESSVASLVAFMDAASPYYDYHTHTLCGIPRFVLFGAPSDYRALVDAVTSLAIPFREHLGPYFAHLLPVLEVIASVAEGGDAYEEFWGQAYKQFSHSGSKQYNGWLSSFVWYVHEEDYKTNTNPLVVKDASLHDWTRIRREHGINSCSEPNHVTSTPFIWHYFDPPGMRMRFIGGVLGVELEDGAITPQLSYGVLHEKA